MMAFRVFLVAVCCAAGTWFLGWWAVPLVAAVYSAMRSGADGTVREAMLGTVLAWSALLVYRALAPAFGRLSSAINGVFPVPTIVVMLIAVVFAAVLAGAAARVMKRS